MNFCPQLSRESRLRQIGHYLSKAVTRMVTAEKETARKSTGVHSIAKPEPEIPEDWITHGIIDYLRRVKYANPREIIRYLDLKRTTCFRRLKLMKDEGLIQSRGNGRGVQYRIASIGF